MADFHESLDKALGHTAESDAPEWCPFKGRCVHPDCLLDLDQCASALMASGSRRDFPMAPVRRPRRVLPPGEGRA